MCVGLVFFSSFFLSLPRSLSRLHHFVLMPFCGAGRESKENMFVFRSSVVRRRSACFFMLWSDVFCCVWGVMGQRGVQTATVNEDDSSLIMTKILDQSEFFPERVQKGIGSVRGRYQLLARFYSPVGRCTCFSDE